MAQTEVPTWRQTAGKWLPFFIYSLVSLLVMGNLIGKGTIFTLDMGFPPEVDPVKAFTGLENGVNSGLLFLLLIKGLLAFIPLWLLQVALLFFIFFLAGISAHRLSPAKNEIGRYFTGLLYTLNPFTFVRFETGQWLVLLGYALTPFLVRQFLVFLDSENKTREGIKVALWFFLVGAVSAHIFSLDLLLIGILSVVFLARKVGKVSWRLLLRQDIVACAALLLVIAISNLYWLALFTGENMLTRLTETDLFIFRSQDSTGIGLAYSLASLHGFWRTPEGYQYISELIPAWHVFFGIVLFLFFTGLIYYWRHRELGTAVIGMFAAAAAGFLLAFGQDAPGFLGNFFRFLFHEVSFFRGFREPQKFIALLALGYAFLGGLGAACFFQLPAKLRQRIVNLALAAIILALPMVFSANMLLGLGGAPEAGDFPPGWQEARELMNKDVSPGRALFLPWHAYIRFHWLDRIIANPAALYFDGEILQGKNIEIGNIYSQSSEPDQLYVQSLLLDKEKITDFGNLVTPLNVTHVLLAKDADFQEYSFLYRQADLELVLDTPELAVFKNSRMADAKTFTELKRGIPFRLLTYYLASAVTMAILIFMLYFGKLRFRYEKS